MNGYVRRCLIPALRLAALLLIGNGILSAQPHIVNRFETNEAVRDMAFRSGTEGYVMSAQVVWHTTDAGATWTANFPLPFHPPKTAIGLFGETGMIIGTEDGGLHFGPHPDSVWTYTQPGNGHAILDIEVIDGNHWVAITDSVILSTIDGGKTYRTFVQQSSNALSFKALDITDASLMHVVENVFNVLRSTDGGETWNPLGTPQHGFGILYDVRFTSPDVGFVASWYPWSLFTTTDGGTTWSPRLFEYPTSIAVDENGIGAYVTNQLLHLSGDGGMTWPDSIPLMEFFPDIDYQEQKVALAGSTSIFLLLTDPEGNRSIISRIDRTSGIRMEYQSDDRSEEADPDLSMEEQDRNAKRGFAGYRNR